MATTTVSGTVAAPRVVPAAPTARINLIVQKRELIAVFGAVSGVCLLVAAWYMLAVGSVIGDALARSLTAVTAAHSQYPKLASLGFIWPPLLSLLQIPLVHIPGLSTYGFSGGIVTALFAGGTAAVFDLIFARAGFRRAARLVAIVLLMVFNPFMLFYGANGMSEMPLIFFVVFGTYAFLRWTDTDRLEWLMAAGVGTALMVLVRYDAWFYAAAFAGAVALVQGWREPGGRTGKAQSPRLPQISANVITYAVPVVFITFLWILFNWQIKGNGLYFLNSEYSNAAVLAQAGERESVTALQASPLNFLLYVFETTVFLAPLLPIGLMALVALTLAERSPRHVALAGILLSVPVFEWVSYRQGQTFGFWRYYITLIPAAAIVMAEVVRTIRAAHVRRALTVLFLGGLGIGALTVAAAMDIGGTERFMDSKPICSSGRTVDQDFVQSLFQPGRKLDVCAVEREMAVYVLAKVPGRGTLTDVSGEGVVMLSEVPSRFVLLSDGDYSRIAANPLAFGVTHVIVSREKTAFSVLDGYFPKVQSDNPPGLVLEKELGKLRLYRIAPGGTAR